MKALVLLLISIIQFAFAGETALVIIDMQGSFIERNLDHNPFPNRRALRNVIQQQTSEINRAKRNNQEIIFIEYNGHGETLYQLQEAARNYQKLSIIKKSTDDIFDHGNSNYNQVLELLHSKEITHLKIIGANGGGCVYLSIGGALSHNFRVSAIQSATVEFNSRIFITPYIFDEFELSYFEYQINRCENCSLELI